MPGMAQLFRPRRRPRASHLLAGIALALPVHAQWTVINVDPAGSIDSVVRAGFGDIQVGTAYTGLFRAGYWSGSADSWVDLHPTIAQRSAAFAAGDGVQGGYALFSGREHAGIWHGSADSWVDLHPPTAYSSAVYGIHGGQQVGYVSIDVPHASLWSGSGGTWIDLNPPAAWSVALDVYGNQQVGYVHYGSDRACIWYGSWESVQYLRPAGPESRANAVYDGCQVGFARNPSRKEAGLWHGTPESWVSLHPAGAFESEAFAVHGDIQVGYATFGGVHRASLWYGTAASWEDLSGYLPGAWGNSVAYSVTRAGRRIYVGGYGFNQTTQRNDALIWTRCIQVEGDLDHDDDVDLTDMAILLNSFGCTPATFCAGDVDRDHDTDLVDLTSLLANFGSTCGQ